MVMVWLQIAISIFIGNVNAEYCTRYDDDTGTCYVDRGQKWIPSDGNISCDSSYPICIITCFGDPYSCGSDQETTAPYIICGTKGNQCTIHCNSNEACYGSIIYSTNSSFVNINITGMDQSKMEIYAPNHGSLHINLLSGQTSFTENKIYSSRWGWTRSIYIDCQHGISCNKNTIDGERLVSSLIYKCDNYCDSTQIVCPDHKDAECHIQCKNSCNNMRIHSADMTLQFVCDYKQCKNTIIECMMNSTLYESQVVANSNNNGIGSFVGQCTDSISSIISKTEHIEFSADLNVYIYYNERSVSTIATMRNANVFTKLMHDAILETYDIISENDAKHDNISGQIINITFCLMFNQEMSMQCGDIDIDKSVQHESQFVAFGLFNIVSTDVDLLLFKQYVVDIVSSDKFMTYFNQNMNIQLFSTDAFECIAINIDDHVIVTKKGVSAVSIHSTWSYPAHMIIVFIIIGICAGTLCSFLCGYSINKWCNSQFLLTKLESDLDETEKHVHTDKNEIISKEKQRQSMDTNDDESSNKLRAIHWGFTNDKYGELTMAKDISSSPSMRHMDALRKHTFSSEIHRQSHSSIHRVSIESGCIPPKEMQHIEASDIALCADSKNGGRDTVVVGTRTYHVVSEDGNLYEDDNYHFEHERAQTLNMERAVKQNAFQHKYKRMRSMKSISSVEIEDLFWSPTASHLEGPKMHKGHTLAVSYDAMCNHDAFHTHATDSSSDQVYASTMPAFSLLHPIAIEISQFDDTSTIIEQMDDDLDDYDANDDSHMDSNNTDNTDISAAINESIELRSMNQSSSAKLDKIHRNSNLSVSRTPSPDECLSTDESSLLDGFMTPTITPLLEPQQVIDIDDKETTTLTLMAFKSKMSDDTEPELPLSPVHSPPISIPSITRANQTQRAIESSRATLKAIVININDTTDAYDCNCAIYGSTHSLSSTKL